MSGSEQIISAFPSFTVLASDNWLFCPDWGFSSKHWHRLFGASPNGATDKMIFFTELFIHFLINILLPISPTWPQIQTVLLKSESKTWRLIDPASQENYDTVHRSWLQDCMKRFEPELVSLAAAHIRTLCWTLARQSGQVLSLSLSKALESESDSSYPNPL